MLKPLFLVASLCLSLLAHAGNPTVELRTSLGGITLELFTEQAPETVKNFLAYVRAGHYDGTLFHRVIDGFMIQGGGFDTTYNQKPTRAPIRNEAGNGLKNVSFSVAMARTGDPHSATAQFFINVADNAFLDHRSPDQRGYGYTVFGRVVQGRDVVARIARTRTGAGGPFASDVPLTPVVIERVRLVERPQL
ncbi:MAG: peptidylprolyl isomerase [Gallionellaceae bacterium]|nr:peptidylprolyl isomerase [Gallionellaceae bacterium]